MPLCAAEHVVETLGDVSISVILLSHTEMPPTTLATMREVLKNRDVAGFELGVVVAGT